MVSKSVSYWSQKTSEFTVRCVDVLILYQRNTGVQLEEVNTNENSHDRAVRHFYITQYEALLLPRYGRNRALRDIYLVIGLYGYRICHSCEVLSIATGPRRRRWFTRHDNNSLPIEAQGGESFKVSLHYAITSGSSAHRSDGGQTGVRREQLSLFWHTL